MPKSHPPYAPEFRQRIVELVCKGRTPEELARQFEPSAQAALASVIAKEQDAGRRAILSELVSRIGLITRQRAGIRIGDSESLTLSGLLEAWRSAERPSTPEWHAVAHAVDYFVKLVGDRRAADVDATALATFELALASRPHQKQGQPMHRTGREALVSAIQSVNGNPNFPRLGN